MMEVGDWEVVTVDEKMVVEDAKKEELEEIRQVLVQMLIKIQGMMKYYHSLSLKTFLNMD